MGSAGNKPKAVESPMQGIVVEARVKNGDEVAAGDELVVLEAMKMEHTVTAPRDGVVRKLALEAGQTVSKGQRLLLLDPAQVSKAERAPKKQVDLDAVRADLQESVDRHAKGHDAQRTEAVNKRHGRGHRTARENLADLIDEGSFIEYGALQIAAQRGRRSEEDLIERTPGDGMVAGIATVNAAQVGSDRARCVVMSYDYMVLAGTQGFGNHLKKDRLFEIAERSRLPVVLFAEGGGGRPGDTDAPQVTGLDCLAFHYFAKLSGLAPLVGIANGRCFAGNAALLGCCDVVIATKGANIGMGGPAMIEGGGLGVVRPEEIGPAEEQAQSGVVDVLVEDEAEAVAVARRYLGYFQERTQSGYEHADQRLLRGAIPENRLQVYDVRHVIETLCDTGSVLELRRGFSPGMITCLARIEGRAVGLIANNPGHLAGAIEADGADKASRFLQLCDAHDLPVVTLVDTPGIMVGPEAERTGLVRHAPRLFVTAASIDVPLLSIVLRKGYGLGAQAMCGGSFKAPLFCVSWPTGEFGGMGLEGAVKLGFRKELESIADSEQREAMFRQMVEFAYQRGKALNVASHFEIDDVIDPVDTRRWIVAGLEAAGPPPARQGKKRPCIDTW